jgi:hypothetical protein
MRRHPVDSSVIAFVGHDPDTNVLEVVFRSGRTYRYLDVPAREYEELLAADSAGRYFNEVIKPRHRTVRLG